MLLSLFDSVSRSRLRTFQLLSGIILLTSFAAPSAADGCKFPGKYIKQLPKIPVQRAIIRYKDGVEKLIIESSLEGEGQDFAWIIPVPAEPTAFEEAPETLLETFSFAVGPRVIHGTTSIDKRTIFFFIVLFIVFSGAPCILLFTWYVLSPSRPLSISGFLLPVLCLLCWNAVVWPNLMRSKGMLDELRTRPDVEVKESIRVGSYDLSVLHAQSAEDLNVWLGENGYLEVPEAGIGIVTDYVSDGWHFVAAKLRRNVAEGAEAFSRAHPLAMTFETDDPVYPMRLTRLANSDVYLELIVIADQRAQVDGMQTDYSNTCRRLTDDFWPPKAKPVYFVRGIGSHVGLPMIANLLWDGCVITKLTETIEPSQMEHDFAVDLVHSDGYRRTFYTPTSAVERVLPISIVLWTLVLPLGGAILRRRVDPSSRGILAFIMWAPLGTLMVLLMGAIMYWRLPKTDFVDTQESVPSFFVTGDFLMEGIPEEGFLQDRTRDEIVTFVTQLFVQKQRSLPDDRKARIDLEDYYDLIEDDQGITLRLYPVGNWDGIGRPHDVVLVSAGDTGNRDPSRAR